MRRPLPFGITSFKAKPGFRTTAAYFPRPARTAFPAERKTRSTVPGDSSFVGLSAMFATRRNVSPSAGSTEAAARNLSP